MYERGEGTNLDLRSVSPSRWTASSPSWALSTDFSKFFTRQPPLSRTPRQIRPLSVVTWVLVLIPPWTHYSLLKRSVDLSFSLLDCDRLQARLIISLNKYSRGSTGTSRLPSPAPGTQRGLINVWGTVKKQKGTLPLQEFGLTMAVASERMQETGKFNVEKANVCVHSLKEGIGQDTQVRHGCWGRGSLPELRHRLHPLPAVWSWSAQLHLWTSVSSLVKWNQNSAAHDRSHDRAESINN